MLIGIPSVAAISRYRSPLTSYKTKTLRSVSGNFNNAFRAWGHTFLFDEDTLTEALHEAGFREVHRVAVGESDDPELAGSERHALAVENAAANEFETMVLEAWKLP